MLDKRLGFVIIAIMIVPTALTAYTQQQERSGTQRLKCKDFSCFKASPRENASEGAEDEFVYGKLSWKYDLVPACFHGFHCSQNFRCMFTFYNIFQFMPTQ